MVPSRHQEELNMEKMCEDLLRGHENMAAMYREAAKRLAQDGDIYGVHRMVTQAIAHDNKARKCNMGWPT
jgi:DNA-binding ferritin-like protein